MGFIDRGDGVPGVDHHSYEEPATNKDGIPWCTPAGEEMLGVLEHATRHCPVL